MVLVCGLGDDHLGLSHVEVRKTSVAQEGSAFQLSSQVVMLQLQCRPGVVDELLHGECLS